MPRADRPEPGVETDRQAETLYALGYRRAQGYLFCRPIPAPEIEARILAGNRLCRRGPFRGATG